MSLGDNRSGGWAVAASRRPQRMPSITDELVIEAGHSNTTLLLCPSVTSTRERVAWTPGREGAAPAGWAPDTSFAKGPCTPSHASLQLAGPTCLPEAVDTRCRPLPFHRRPCSRPRGQGLGRARGLALLLRMFSRSRSRSRSRSHSHSHSHTATHRRPSRRVAT